MRRWKWGQTIIEVLVAVGVVALGLLALVQVATKSVANSGFSKRQAVATALAVEGMEWIKGQRSGLDWEDFYKSSGSYNLNSFPGSWTGWVAGVCSGSVPGMIYTRCVTMAAEAVTPVPGPGPVVQQLRVVVDVTWDESGRVAKSSQETVFLRR